jgi:hypothetical protein
MMNRSSSIRAVFICLAALWLFQGAAFIRAEESAEEKAEAAESAEEDKRAAELDGEADDSLKSLMVRGRLVLAPGKSSVVGTLTTPERTYQVKVENEKVLELLQPLDNKDAALNGRLRNKGKYFIATGIAVQGVQTPLSLDNPAGL